MFGIKRRRERRNLLRWMRPIPLPVSEGGSIQEAATQATIARLHAMTAYISEAHAKLERLKQFAAFAEQEVPGLYAKFEVYMAVKAKVQKPTEEDAS